MLSKLMHRAAWDPEVLLSPVASQVGVVLVIYCIYSFISFLSING